jgi:hypothetical protein
MVELVSGVASVIAVLQAAPTPQVPQGPLGVVGSAVSTFLTTLLVGAILIAVAPDYTERQMEAVRADPLDSFLYGFAAIVFVVLLTVLLFVTIVGLVLAIPLAVLAFLLWAVGAAIAFLAISDRLVGREDGWAKPLVVAAAIDGGLTLTGIGGLVALCIGAAGFGAVLRDWLA